MRYLFGFLCVCALGAMPLVACSDTQRACETGADCSDDNECTNDVCDSASGTCSNTPVDDGTDCTFDGVSGVCVSGVCGENLCEGVVCEDDGNECTDDVCNFADGTCNVPDGAACGSGACLDGACTVLTTVSGEVILFTDLGPATPAADATVSVVGTSLSTTTDDDGNFSFDVFAGDWFLPCVERGHLDQNQPAQCADVGGTGSPSFSHCRRTDDAVRTGVGAECRRHERRCLDGFLPRPFRPGRRDRNVE